MRKGLWPQSEEIKSYANTLYNLRQIYLKILMKSACQFSLTKPKPQSKLEKRFLNNYFKKVWNFYLKKAVTAQENTSMENFEWYIDLATHTHTYIHIRVHIYTLSGHLESLETSDKLIFNNMLVTFLKNILSTFF